MYVKKQGKWYKDVKGKADVYLLYLYFHAHQNVVDNK